MNYSLQNLCHQVLFPRSKEHLNSQRLFAHSICIRRPPWRCTKGQPVLSARNIRCLRSASKRQNAFSPRSLHFQQEWYWQATNPILAIPFKRQQSIQHHLYDSIFFFKRKSILEGSYLLLWYQTLIQCSISKRRVNIMQSSWSRSTSLTWKAHINYFKDSKSLTQVDTNPSSFPLSSSSRCIN